MTGDARATTFVMEAAGFIGSELVKVGPVQVDDIQGDAVFSNIRLRGLGFRFRYPTLEQGLHQVCGALDE